MAKRNQNGNMATRGAMEQVERKVVKNFHANAILSIDILGLKHRRALLFSPKSKAVCMCRLATGHLIV